MPAILVETAFISNSSDANLLNTRQSDFSIAIANSILSYFNGITIDTSYILSQAKNIGLLKGTSLEFAFFEAETPIKVVSLFPKVTMSASVPVTQKFYHCITIAIENYRNPSTTSYSFVLAETASNPATNLNVQPVSMLLPGLALMAVLAAGILVPPAAAISAAAGIVAVVFLPIIQKIKN